MIAVSLRVCRFRGWQVVGWVVIKETAGLQQETDVSSRHDRIVFGTRDMGMSEGVPEDHILLFDRTVCLDPSNQAVAAEL